MHDLLGERMYKTSSMEDVTQYTKNFEGCTLVYLDEVPVAGSIMSFQDSMKSLISEEKFNCRAMHQQGYSQQNTFNLILTSNNNCVLLTQSNNVRYYVPTCSNKYAGNEHADYFNKIYSYLKREDVKLAIFQEFMRTYEEEVKPINWLMPENNHTEAGKVKIIESLPKSVKFIKSEYLMKGLDLNETCNDLFDEYKRKHPSEKIHITTFGYNLGLLDITSKRIMNKEFNGRKYIKSYAELKEAFITKNWLLDEELEDLEIMEQTKGNSQYIKLKKPDSEHLDDGLLENADDEVKIDYEQLYKDQLAKVK